MFLRNHTETPAVCTRGTIDLANGTPARSITTVATCEGFALGDDLKPADVPAPPFLAPVMRATILDGTGVTLAGEIPPPERGLLAARASLRLGAVEQILVARGPRHWVRCGGDLIPSQPEPWTPLEMQWSEAFGGSDTLEAGRDPLSGLPTPQVTVSDPRNPSGKGFAFTMAKAVGRSLPRIELLGEQLTRWSHLSSNGAPMPGCFAPCNDVVAMTVGSPPGTGRPHRLLAAHHVAPWYLIMPTAAPETRCIVTGLGATIDFVVPRSRLELRATGKPRGARIGTRLRALHIDARARRAFAIWHHVVSAAGQTPDLYLRYAERAGPR
jgi:hypothetical protein